MSWCVELWLPYLDALWSGSDPIGPSGVSIEEIMLEVEILRSLHHRNIVRLFEVYEHRDQFVLVMELCARRS